MKSVHNNERKLNSRMVSYLHYLITSVLLRALVSRKVNTGLLLCREERSNLSKIASRNAELTNGYLS